MSVRMIPTLYNNQIARSEECSDINKCYKILKILLFNIGCSTIDAKDCDPCTFKPWMPTVHRIKKEFGLMN